MKTLLACFLVFLPFLLFCRLNESIFLKKLQDPPYYWMHEQIHGDLLPFQTLGISQEALEATYVQCADNVLIEWKQRGRNDLFARYRIIENCIYRQWGRDNYLEGVLLDLAKVITLPQVDFIVCLADGAPESYHKKDFWEASDERLQAPLYARGTVKNTKYVALLPDFGSFSTYDLFQNALTSNERHSWHKKKKVAFWRGAPSDFHDNNIDRHSYEATKEIYTTRPRFIVSKLSVLYPKDVNAGIVSSYGHAGNLTKLLDNEGVRKPLASIDEHISYAYLPCLDGWMCTYPGYLWRLVSNSVIFKHDSEQVLWFYKALHPYAHYIPIEHDCKNLLETIEWARTHDHLCEQIARQATELALNELTADDAYVFLYRSLKLYESYQNFDVHELKWETTMENGWEKVD